MKLSRMLALCAICAFGAAPAMACRAPSSERYLLWFERPTLLPGEVAIELDMEDFFSNRKPRDWRLSHYKMESGFAAALDEATIEVRREMDTCEREIATGETEKLFVVGVLTRNPQGALQLIPRYMKYDNPIRVRAYEAMPRQGRGD